MAAACVTLPLSAVLCIGDRSKDGIEIGIRIDTAENQSDRRGWSDRLRNGSMNERQIEREVNSVILMGRSASDFRERETSKRRKRFASRG